MTITMFGYIWIIYLIYIIAKKKVHYMMEALFIAMILQQPAMIMLYGKGVGPNVITAFLFVLWFVFLKLIGSNGKFKIKKLDVYEVVSILSCIMLIFAIYMSLKKRVASQLLDTTGLYVIQLCIYILCFFAIWDLKEDISIEQKRIIIMNIIWCVAIIGIIQYMNTLRIINISNILKILLYNDTSMGLRYKETMYPWSLPRLFSSFQEPSYCSAFLVGSFYYLIAYGIKNKTSLFLSLLVLLEIILTFSSTAYGAFAVCGLIYLILSRNKKALKYLVPIGLFVLLVMFMSGQIGKIWTSVIVNKLDYNKSGSAWERNSWNEKAMKVFYESPVWGGGYKNCRASYIIYSILGQLGIVGLISWLGIWLPFLLKSFFKKNKKIVPFVLFMLGVIVSMMIAIPDIDFCVFWLAMYLVALVYEKKEWNEKNAM